MMGTRVVGSFKRRSRYACRRAFRQQSTLGSPVIKPDSRTTLHEIAKVLRAQPHPTLVIVGHAASQGTHDYNMALSRRRAEADSAELAGSCGTIATGHHPLGAGRGRWGASQEYKRLQFS
jgi:OmpA family